jgi:hypothetical protein
LIDKLDCAVPRIAEYTREFANLVNISMSPEWHGKVWREGGIYARRGDFREVSGGELPVIVHQNNRYDKKAGDKVELIETGSMTVGEMAQTISRVYAVDPIESRIMRLDLAADVEGVSVSWFRDHTEFRAKQTNREWSMQSITQRRAQTLYSGVKPHQLRIYDKTAHREKLYASELRKATKEERAHMLSFDERWGHPASKLITRVERQIGGAEVEKFGYCRVGHLAEVYNADPFLQIVFPEERKRGRIKRFSPEDRVGIDWMRDRVARDGVVNAKALLREYCGSRWGFYRRWNRWQEFVMQEASEKVTRADLLESFRVSTLAQLNYAA